jgi:hypothetical protein
VSVSNYQLGVNGMDAVEHSRHPLSNSLDHYEENQQPKEDDFLRYSVIAHKINLVKFFGQVNGTSTCRRCFKPTMLQIFL